MQKSNVMKQNEHYNHNSKPQLTAIQKSFSYIAQAIEEHKSTVIPTDTFFIVDYGCSHGANAVVAIQAIIEAVQQKYGTGLSSQICAVFNDLSTNDWSTLFQTITGLFCSSLASGKSFYEQILPSNRVQFGYTATAIHWLSKKPCNLQQHCYIFSGQPTAEEMKRWKTQAADDYRTFLQHRSNEMKKGQSKVAVSSKREEESALYV